MKCEKIINATSVDVNEEDRITSQLIEEVRLLSQNTPDGVIKDADTILADLIDGTDMEETGSAEFLFDIWQRSCDKKGVEKVFELFTNVTFQDFLKTCIKETTRPATFDIHTNVANIYTDGACKGNPGNGGWGAIIIQNGKTQEISGGELYTTNNRMELTAVISALSTLKEPSNVIITTDSKLIVDAINKKWLENWSRNGWIKSDRKPVLNPELWKELEKLLHKHNVEFKWIKGHAGHPYNERCDKLAVKESRRFDKV